MGSVQEKINVAISLIGFLTNKLNVINTEMALVPSSGSLAKQFQIQREKALEDFFNKIFEDLEDFADLVNTLEALEEEELTFINSMMEFICKDDEVLEKTGYSVADIDLHLECNEDCPGCKIDAEQNKTNSETGFYEFKDWELAFKFWFKLISKEKYQFVISTNIYSSGYWIEDVENGNQGHECRIYKTNKEVQELYLRVSDEIKLAGEEGRNPKLIF